MTGIKKAIYDYLMGVAGVTSLIGTRLKPQLISMGQDTPYIIFERDSVEEVRHLTGVSNLMLDSFSFVLYADTQDAVESLKDAMQTAMNAVNRTTSNGRKLIIAEQTGANDSLDIRTSGDQEPAFSEIMSYNIWYS